MMAKAKKTAAPARIPAEEIPYAVPANWQWVRLGEITDIIGGGTPSSKVVAYYENGTIPWLSPADLSTYKGIYISCGAKNITELGLEKSSARLLPKDTVCLSSRAPIGYVVIAQNALCTNQGFKSFLPSKYYLPKFLYWYLKGNKTLLESYASGTTFLELSGRKAALIPLPLPPRAEQERIVARIEELFEKLDAAEEKLRAVVEDSSARRAALLRRAFTGDLTKNWRAAHGRTMDTWEEKKLGDCGTWQGGGTPSKSHPEYWENGDLLWVTSKDMKAKIIEDTQLHINQKGVENSSATYVEKPSLLFVMRSGILRHTLPVAMVKKPFTVNQDLKVLTPDSDELEFLYWACKAHADDIRSTCMKSGTTVESISAPALMNYKIPVPPLDEQKEIVRLLDELLAREDEARAAAEAALAKIPALRQAVLARAFRGALGTNDPAEPPALSE